MAEAKPDPREMLWRFALQSREHAVILLDTDRRITWFSPGAERLFGHAPADIVGQPSSRLFTPEDAAQGMDRLEVEVATFDNAAEDDRWMMRADGSRFWASGALLSIVGEAGEPVGYVKILRNRTDQREQVVALSNQLRELELERKRKDIFFSTLSHELHNPLAPLSYAVRIVRDAIVEPTPEIEYALRIVQRQTEMLRRLVDDLVDFARLGAGKVELNRQPLALADVLAQSAESVRPLMQERRHAFEVACPDAPMTVDGDRDRLQQVFVNLLTNAAKYTPPGGRIWVHATTEGREAVVHVRDTGIGIPTDMQPRIFDLFTQVEASRAYSHGGLGIGLSLVKNFVDMHDGLVQVRSDGEGKGSEFTVRLPLKAA